LRFAVILLTAALLQDIAFAQKFHPDDPVYVDPDDAVDVRNAARRQLSDYYDFLENTFLNVGDRRAIPAVNINTLGEVPDSSWFQNRHGRTTMSIEALERGPNTGDGPASGTWRVVDAKTEGVTPGFRIRDGRGDQYFIKFDPITNPEMATAAEVISTKFFHAFGYNVPENYLVFFNREQLEVDPKARVEGDLGKTRPMTTADLDDIFRRVHRSKDGFYRAVASKLLPGRPLGPFKYYGARADDPNDVFPHEHRRELRGLSVFCAWLNHDDSRAINTLDMLVESNGRSTIRHYLIDFGSTLGSGSIAAQKPRAGYEYLWEPKPVLGRVFTLGIWDRAWIRARYPDFPSIGRFESDVFDPGAWRPEYPNPAFLNTLPEDGYWAAKIIMAFTVDDIRAIVRTGRLSDPRAEEYLVETLIERRNKIGRYWFSKVLSLDNFRLDGDMLRFDHLESLYDFAPAPAAVTARWFHFDNETGKRTPLGPETEHALGAAPIPQAAAGATGETYFLVELSNRVHVYLRRTSGSFSIVGVERF